MGSPGAWSVWLFPLSFLLLPLSIELSFRKRRRLFRALSDLKRHGKTVETAELTGISQSTCDVSFTVTRKIEGKYRTERVTALTIQVPRCVYRGICEEYGDPEVEYEHMVLDSTSNVLDGGAIEMSGHSDTAGLNFSVDSIGQRRVNNIRLLYDIRDISRFVFESEEQEQLSGVGWWMLDAVRSQPWRLSWPALCVVIIWLWPILGWMTVSAALAATLGGLVLAGMVSSLLICDGDRQLRAMFTHDCMTEVLSIHERPLFTHRFSFGSLSMSEEDDDEGADQRTGDEDNVCGDTQGISHVEHTEGLSMVRDMEVEDERLVEQIVRECGNDTSEHSITTSNRI